MKLIKNNPYRIVGLLVGATAREQERQVNRLKQYIVAEQEPQDDFSFPVLGTIHRTVDSVSEAAAKLNYDNDKMNAALFWFYNGYAITDEPAFEALKDSDIQNAKDIWSKLTVSGEVTQRNSSAFQNLSTLLLHNSFNRTTINQSLFEEALKMKFFFFESDFVNDFKVKATDETFQKSKKEIQIDFLNALQHEIENHGGITSSNFIEIISKQNFSAKKDFLQCFVQKPIEQIENKIETTKAKRKANKANAANSGKELYDSVGSELMQVKNILGTTNLKYTTITDKVSNEILQCGIDYFKHYRDSSNVPGNVSMDLFKRARIFAVGNIAKQRCQENTKNIQEWIDNKPERDKQKKIANDLQFITSKLERFQSLSDTIANAKDLIDSCKPKLANIKKSLGSSDDFYLKISSATVNNAQGMLVTVVNNEQERLKIIVNTPFMYTEIKKLKTTIRVAYSVSNTIGKLDMDSELRNRYNKNHSTLKSIFNQFREKNWAEENPGCLIAIIIGIIIFLIRIFQPHKI